MFSDLVFIEILCYNNLITFLLKRFVIILRGNRLDPGLSASLLVNMEPGPTRQEHAPLIQQMVLLKQLGTFVVNGERVLFAVCDEIWTHRRRTWKRLNQE